MANIELQGVNQLLENLRTHLGAGAERVAHKALREAGEMIAEAQRSKVAVSDKNQLHIRDNIKVSVVKNEDGGKIVEIGAGKGDEETGWRVHFLEFGTGQRGQQSPSPPKPKKDVDYRQDWVGMAAQPFIYPAFHENKEAVKAYLADELRKGVRG